MSRIWVYLVCPARLHRKSSLEPDRQLVADFRPVEDRRRPLLGDPLVTRYSSFRAASALGNAPFVFTTFRSCRLYPSTVFVVSISRRISAGYSNIVARSSHFLSHERTATAYFLPQRSPTSSSLSSPASRVGAAYTVRRSATNALRSFHETYCQALAHLVDDAALNVRGGNTA